MLETSTIGFIGGGNMAEALLAGIVEDGAVPAGSVLVVEPDADRAAALADRYGISPASIDELAARADIIVVAVKPQVVDEVLEELRGGVTARSLVLSVAAGVPTSRFEAALPGVPVVRAMPNTPALLGAGMSVISAGAAADATHLEAARAILAPTGKVLALDESQLDAVTAVSGSGPAYFFYLAEALIDAAQGIGLDHDVAAELVVQTAFGAASMLRESGKDAAALRAAVTSPGGTTEAGLAVLYERDANTLIADVVRAARDRSAELGRG
ncbi:pyrroline-5-carboxylate reductase [Blastococcus sp. Marseille-P5729]|uniref:pyrroline-5-carboxylate reductase n=1 Tax=Blastococcus sp. Marseille-P5729 TaxID=2086582 RepID=UPI000D100465|nr:pyrroline-5-carboxylate reductase [Blastococcus sp. Marseille-P5729]